ncbi:MAG: hypothetical protein KAR45_22580 [Desulfobacteraceae bacterium]|nr:hypothetical protein [Desulfobacteraceae bacterium]
MVYDPEKYRGKREKVLGIRKRGLGFGTISFIVVGVIVLGLSFTAVPKAVSYITTRNLDDAIYKLDGTTFKNTIIKDIESIEGVVLTNQGKHGTRLVITFDRRVVNVSEFVTVFNKNNLNATLLNRVNHRQRQNTLKEEEELETP